MALSKPARLIFMGFRRGGSSIAFSCLSTFFEASGLQAVDIVAARHKKGQPESVTHLDLDAALSAHHLVGCFREPLTHAIASHGSRNRVVLLVRDPRDCIVSWYYARRLHGIGIDDRRTLREYLSEPDDLYSFADLLGYARDNGARILKYEDMVMSPAHFLAAAVDGMDLAFCQKAFDKAVTLLSCLRLVQDKDSHNRSGAPFEALRTVGSEILDTLNARHGNIIRDLGYPEQPGSIHLDGLWWRLEFDAVKRFMAELAHENAIRIGHLVQHDNTIAGLAAAVDALTRTVSQAEKALEEISHAVTVLRESKHRGAE